MRCKVCSKQANEKSDYCGHHTKAYESILSNFEAWKKALDIEWKVYLKRVADNSATGVWVKEVAQRLLLEK